MHRERAKPPPRAHGLGPEYALTTLQQKWSVSPGWECGEQSHRYANACADKGVERCMDCERLRPDPHENKSIPQENRPEIVAVWTPGAICTCNQ